MEHPPPIKFIPVPDGMAPGVGYSHVVTGSGRLVIIAGQVAYDEDGKTVGNGDFEAQARQVFANMQRCLAAAGAGFEHVVKLTYFFTDMRYLPLMRSIRDEFIDTAHPPPSTAVQVAGLARPELLLEIETLALVPER